LWERGVRGWLLEALTCPTCRRWRMATLLTAALLAFTFLLG
jgi:hypothetical protein